MRNKPLGIALVLSLVIHSLVFVVLPGIGINFHRDHGARVEMVYSPFTPPLKPPPAKAVNKEPTQSTVEQVSPPVVQSSPPVGQASRLSMIPSASKQKSPPVVQESHPVGQASHLSIDSNPFVPTSAQEGIAYTNYFEALRNKIQESVRYPKEWSIGEVYVSFIIKSDGSLKLDAINVLDKSSTNNKLLREASIQTITAAAPFPPFPKGLNRQEICFNIPIVYKSGK